MPSVRKSYDEELLQLDTLLARMGHEAGAAIESALTALRNDDIELARSVVARDSQIDAGEHEIEHRCLQLLLRQHLLRVIGAVCHSQRGRKGSCL